MDIIRILGVGLVTVIASLILKSVKPELSVFVSLAGGVIILSMTINSCMDIVNTFTSFIEKTGLDDGVLKSVLKIVGVGYITEFSASVCNDAGNSSMGDKIIFAGKIMILVMSLPIINSIIDIIVSMLP